MKNQFWAVLGSQASTVKKKFGADYEQLLRAVFHGQKINIIFFENIVASAPGRTERLHRIKVKKVKKSLGSIFYKGKTRFF